MTTDWINGAIQSIVNGQPKMASDGQCTPSPKSGSLKAEADPYGIGQHIPGAKLDAGKPDTSLLLMFGRALLDVARVGTFGSRKYTRGGWQHVDSGVERYTAAMLRHMLQEGQGVFDAESGLRHAAQVAWNALARLELLLREEEKDNDAKQEQQGISGSACAAGQATSLPTVHSYSDWRGLTGGTTVAGSTTGVGATARFGDTCHCGRCGAEWVHGLAGHRQRCPIACYL